MRVGLLSGGAGLLCGLAFIGLGCQVAYLDPAIPAQPSPSVWPTPAADAASSHLRVRRDSAPDRPISFRNYQWGDPEAELGQRRKVELVIIILATGRPIDIARMAAAEATWLRELDFPEAPHSMDWLYPLCKDDPDRDAALAANPHVVVVDCEHGYSKLTTKTMAAFRYVHRNYKARITVKTDVDTGLHLECIMRRLHPINLSASSCQSFGMGWWNGVDSQRVVHGSKSRLDNTAYFNDTGHWERYPNYASGMFSAWSEDNLRHLAMADHAYPKFRDYWTMEDAAVGTFTYGGRFCRLMNLCHMETSLTAEQFSTNTFMWRPDVAYERKGAMPRTAQRESEGFCYKSADEGRRLWAQQVRGPDYCAARCRDEPRCEGFRWNANASFSCHMYYEVRGLAPAGTKDKAINLLSKNCD